MPPRSAMTAWAILIFAALGLGAVSTAERRAAETTTDRNGAAKPAHPLDPLTREEIAAAARALIAAGRTGPDTRVPLIALNEPAKADVLAFAPGRAVRREAFVVVYERTANKTFEAIVDLATERVLAWKEVADVQPALMMGEMVAARQLVRADARWRAAMTRRGITDLDGVHISPAPVGLLRVQGAPRTRLARALSFYRGGASNTFARPIAGVVAYVDLNALSVLGVDDTDLVPVATSSGALDEASIGRLRAAPRPLEVVQREGPSFVAEGRAVRWQNWRFRFDLDPREGLVLYTVGYEEQGKLRSILYRASVSEVFTVYADPEWALRGVFDEGEIGLGRYANTLEPLTDAPEHAAFASAVFATDRGGAYEVPRAVALFERDGGLLWKHVSAAGHNESRRSRQLVLSWIAQQGNYEYGFSWIFHQDGTLELEVLLTGIVLPRAVTMDASAGPATHGHLMAPHVEAVHHQHWFNFRLDLDVDGPDNTVIESNTEAMPPGPGNPYRSGFVVRESSLRREGDARRQVNSAASRTWKVVNPSVRNALGAPVGYTLVPGENAFPLAAPGSPLRRRAGFLDAHLWVTRYDPAQRYAAGDYPNQRVGGDGLPRWIAANRPIENQDVVLWYTMGITHVPRPEDWPVMSAHRAGFKLVPTGFFSRNAALDVPRPADAKPR